MDVMGVPRFPTSLPFFLRIRYTSRARPARADEQLRHRLPDSSGRLDFAVRSGEYWRDRARDCRHRPFRGARPTTHASRPVRSVLRCSPSRHTRPMDLCGIFGAIARREAALRHPRGASRGWPRRCATAGPTANATSVTSARASGPPAAIMDLTTGDHRFRVPTARSGWSCTARSTMLPSCGGKRPHGVTLRSHGDIETTPLLPAIRRGPVAPARGGGDVGSRCGMRRAPARARARSRGRETAVLDRSAANCDRIGDPGAARVSRPAAPAESATCGCTTRWDTSRALTMFDGIHNSRMRNCSCGRRSELRSDLLECARWPAARDTILGDRQRCVRRCFRAVKRELCRTCAGIFTAGGDSISLLRPRGRGIRRRIHTYAVRFTESDTTRARTRSRDACDRRSITSSRRT